MGKHQKNQFTRVVDKIVAFPEKLIRKGEEIDRTLEGKKRSTRTASSRGKRVKHSKV